MIRGWATLNTRNKKNSLPGIGSGISLDEIQWMAVDAYAKSEAIPARVANRLKALKKSLVKDGQAVAQGDATVRELATRLGCLWKRCCR